jgi:hypothetical protein
MRRRREEIFRASKFRSKIAKNRTELWGAAPAQIKREGAGIGFAVPAAGSFGPKRGGGRASCLSKDLALTTP